MDTRLLYICSTGHILSCSALPYTPPSLTLHHPTPPFPPLPCITLPYPSLPYPASSYPTLPYPTLQHPILPTLPCPGCSCPADTRAAVWPAQTGGVCRNSSADACPAEG